MFPFVFLAGYAASKFATSASQSVEEFVQNEINEFKQNAFKRTVIIGALVIGVIYFTKKG